VGETVREEQEQEQEQEQEGALLKAKVVNEEEWQGTWV
jgi:hypothetical protein